VHVRILVIGDVVGKPGRTILREELPSLRERESVDLVIANAENVAGGSGITPDLARRLANSGIDCITLGDHCFKKAEIMPTLQERDDILRPINLPAPAPGRGWTVIETAAAVRVAVICAIGRIFMKPNDCPFLAVDRALGEMDADVSAHIVDFHAEATSEKVAMGWYLDGRASAVIGTHTHIPTSDERVLPGGTAYITDIGMTGPHDSVLGRRKDRVLSSLVTGVPARYDVAKGDVRIQGVVLDIDADTGRATGIRRIEVTGSAASGSDEHSEETG